LMPLDAIFTLEEETGRVDMSEAIASARGRRFADVEATPANGSVMAAHAETVVRMGELMTEGALAFADGQLTPAESARIDRALSKVEQGIDEYRKILAGAKAAGGLKVVPGGN
ncbi:hypothetical protein, partial [Mesorhizobium sp. M2A.F.Ca.ET.067.02.1.1]|uniref:hypothetical protein n=1 Tax=Mesorhizobium sp. M2A.F.Ca.ET.067.02.1.1 TaxID=2496749 RepID=UPI001673BF05